MSATTHVHVKAAADLLIGQSLLPTFSMKVSKDMQRFLIGLGLVILLAGLAWPLLARIGLGRLPGDILIQRGGTTFYFPLVTCIIVSIALSTVFWLLNR